MILSSSSLFNVCKRILKPSTFTLLSSTNKKANGMNVFKGRYEFCEKTDSSRMIDLKIRQQRWKDLQNDFQSLKTSFGLRVPTHIPEKYPKPEKIEYSLQQLRECSNFYPQYLLLEFKNPESRYYEAVNSQINKLWKAEKKEALEFISFLLVWRLYRHNRDDFEAIIIRMIQNADLTMDEMFELLSLFLRVNEEPNAAMHGNEASEQTFNKEENHQRVSEQKKIPNMQSQRDTLEPIHHQLITVIENKIIQRLESMNANEYDALFKIINMLRLFDLEPELTKSQREASKAENQRGAQESHGSEEVSKQRTMRTQSVIGFFNIIEKAIIKNLRDIPLPSVVQMAVHYANNAKESQDHKIEILEAIEQKLINNLKFLNHEEIIALIYSYMKNSLMSPQFAKEITARICLTYGDMPWETKKKILSLASNFPNHERMLILSQAQGEVIRGKPIVTEQTDGSLKKEYDPKVFVEVEYQLVPEIYLVSYENGLLTPQMVKMMQNVILNNFFNLSVEDVVRSVWLFTVAPPSNDKGNSLLRIHKKLEVVIEGGFQGGSYSIKNVSMLVWSMCNSGHNNQMIYKEKNSFWDNIEAYLQEKLIKVSKQNDNRQKLSACSYILWAYTFNKPLKFKTVELITEMIFETFEPNLVIEKQESRVEGALQNLFVDKTVPETSVSADLITPFHLINILTFYSSISESRFPKNIAQRIKYHCLKTFTRIYHEMTYIELMKCLKYFQFEGENGTKSSTENQSLAKQPQQQLTIGTDVWMEIIEIFRISLQEIEYQHIMGVVGMIISCPLGLKRHPQCIELVNKLMARKKSLEQLQEGSGPRN